MASDPLADAIDLLTTALAGKVSRLEAQVHLIATDALEDANSAEDAADELGVTIQTVGLAAAEVMRALAQALAGAFAALPDGSAIEIDLGGGAVIVDKSTDPDALVIDLLNAIQP